MSRIRSSGTSPEVRLGELLRTMFPTADIVEHPGNLPGKPDWWLPQIRLAIFADGCFFHKCPKHFIMPENNQSYWKPKIEGNKARDRKNDAALQEMNIIPVRIWEHNLRNDLTAARRKIRRIIRATNKREETKCNAA